MNTERYYGISRRLLNESRWQQSIAQALAVTGNTQLSERLFDSSELLKTLAEELIALAGIELANTQKPMSEEF